MLKHLWTNQLTTTDIHSSCGEDAGTRKLGGIGEGWVRGGQWWRCVVRFMIVGNHDRVGHSLGNNFVCVILDGEDDSETKFLILVSAVASNTHGKLNLLGSLGKS